MNLFQLISDIDVTDGLVVLHNNHRWSYCKTTGYWYANGGECSFTIPDRPFEQGWELAASKPSKISGLDAIKLLLSGKKLKCNLDDLSFHIYVDNGKIIYDDGFRNGRASNSLSHFNDGTEFEVIE